MNERLVHVDRAHAPLLRCEGRHGPEDRCPAVPEWVRRSRAKAGEDRLPAKDMTGGLR